MPNHLLTQLNIKIIKHKNTTALPPPTKHKIATPTLSSLTSKIATPAHAPHLSHPSSSTAPPLQSRKPADFLHYTHNCPSTTYKLTQFRRLYISSPPQSSFSSPSSHHLTAVLTSIFQPYPLNRPPHNTTASSATTLFLSFNHHCCSFIQSPQNIQQLLSFSPNQQQQPPPSSFSISSPTATASVADQHPKSQATIAPKSCHHSPLLRCLHLRLSTPVSTCTSRCYTRQSPSFTSTAAVFLQPPLPLPPTTTFSPFPLSSLILPPYPSALSRHNHQQLSRVSHHQQPPQNIISFFFEFIKKLFIFSKN